LNFLAMNNSAPLHIAIIPDGNRRWARERKFHPWKGHERAIENFRSLTEWCRKNLQGGVLTVWCFSTENWKRDPEEVSHLMRLLEQYLKKEQEGFLREKTRFLHSGRTDRIPASLGQALRQTQEATAGQKDFTLHLAVDYGGKDEVIRATERLKGAPVSEENIRSHLDHPELPDIDLVVRTSGEQRTSNFCLWQSTYAEWTFVPKFFPDFTAEDLARAVEDFRSRSRRFGG